MAEIDTTPITDEVVDEVVEIDATPITDEMAVTDAIPIVDEAETTDIEATATSDTKVTNPDLAEPSVHTDKEFLRGSSDRSGFTEYVDHVAYQLSQREVYIFFV